METIILIVQLVISLVLVLIILAQVKEGSGGLFGSAQSTVRTRRGAEKTLFQLTIILAIVFLGLSIAVVRLLH
ncbi:hypothetical protein GBAR_LOCUS19022 [Geodia barretti]|uniref:Probable protein-export membrane protein SecG n=1 Tax=Geodia barretti TaxID=519541 RepID=A0AA35SR09_GEOBA|nr:hypothetical protein GBAR_LOCUS19022 [Geodia barretti]